MAGIYAAHGGQGGTAAGPDQYSMGPGDGDDGLYPRQNAQFVPNIPGPTQGQGHPGEYSGATTGSKVKGEHSESLYLRLSTCTM